MAYERLGDLYSHQRLGSFEVNRFGNFSGSLLESTAKRIAEVRAIGGALTGATEKEIRRAAERQRLLSAKELKRRQQLQDEETEYRRRLELAKTSGERERLQKQLALRQEEAAHRRQIELAELRLLEQQQQQLAAGSQAKLKATQSKNTMIAFSAVVLVAGLIGVVILSK